MFEACHRLTGLGSLLLIPQPVDDALHHSCLVCFVPPTEEGIPECDEVPYLLVSECLKDIGDSKLGVWGGGNTRHRVHNARVQNPAQLIWAVVFAGGRQRLGASSSRCSPSTRSDAGPPVGPQCESEMGLHPTLAPPTRLHCVRGSPCCS